MAYVSLTPDSRSLVDRVLRRPSITSTASTVSSTTTSSRSLRERFWSVNASNNFSTTSVSTAPSTCGSLKPSKPYVPQHAYRDSCALPSSHVTSPLPTSSSSSFVCPSVMSSTHSSCSSPATPEQPQLRHIFSHTTKFVPRSDPSSATPARSEPAHEDKAASGYFMHKSSSLALHLAHKREPAASRGATFIPNMTPAPVSPIVSREVAGQTIKQKQHPEKQKKGLGHALVHYIKPGGLERSGR